MLKKYRSNLAKVALASGSSLIALLASPAAAQTVCVTTPLGVLDCEPTSTSAAVSLPGQTEPVTVTLPDDYSSTTTLDVDSTEPIEIVADGVATIDAATGPALALDSGADVTAQVTALATSGDGAAGALLTAADEAILVVDDTVTTAGDFSDGINVTAGTVDVTVDDVRTAGVESDGVEVVAVSGPATLDADVIETLGSGSTDAIVRAAGDIDANVGVLRTGGDQALGLDLQNDAGACAVLGAGSCDIDAVAGSITTDGFGSIGALVVAAGDTDVTVDALQTGGDEAAGLDLSADPTACVALGVGGCDTAFTVDNLATNGARSPGAVVRAVGDIDGNVGVLTTDGEDAVGLDLGSDPAACVILGAGACETSFSVGQLTTNGDGATGALVRAAGPTTADIGVLETFGDDATGVDIAADPTACAVLGIGQCDTTLTAERISTAGDLAGGLLIDSPGRIFADPGAVTTEGDGSPAITLITDPTVCAVLGTGACGVALGVAPDTDAPGGPDGGTPGAPSGTDVDTDGDDSPGVVIVTPGPVDADIGDVDTDGDNSPGVVVDGGEGPIDVDFDNIDTSGDDSPGVDIAGTGPINVGGGNVTTRGVRSRGIVVVGDDGPVTIDVGTIATIGPDSDGIDVTTTTGDQTILAGPITVAGLGSNGIDANATGCADVDVTARGAIASASGFGINATSACTVSVTTLADAPVAGAAAGINVVSGTGATVTVGDALASSGGPALNVDGAAAEVLIEAEGMLGGRFDLTDSDDLLTNAGMIEATEDSSFGAGTDALVNSGTIRADGGVTFAGLESSANSGMIDLRDGATDDVLTLSGSYDGTGAAALGVDAASAAADRLVIGGAATGSTEVLVDGGGLFINGAVVVDAGAGTSATAFALETESAGLVDYSLTFAAGTNDFTLYGSPSGSAVAAGLLAGAAREVSYLVNDAVGTHLGAGGGGLGGENPRVARAFWAQAYGMTQEREMELDATPFGQATTYDLSVEQDWYGVQAGYDIGGGAGTVFGITGGYANSDLELSGTPLRIGYEAVNLGAYGRLAAGPLSIRGLVKYEWFWSDIVDRTVGFSASPDGRGWGGWLEAGYRLGTGPLFVEPLASIEYSSIEFDDFAGLGTTVASDEADGLRGKAGVRVGTLLSDGPGRVEAYGKVQAIHEFGGEDQLTLTNNGLGVAFDLPRTDTYGRATLGLAGELASYLSGFVEGTADFAGGVDGFGGRAGFSLRF